MPSSHALLSSPTKNKLREKVKNLSLIYLLLLWLSLQFQSGKETYYFIFPTHSTNVRVRVKSILDIKEDGSESQDLAKLDFNIVNLHLDADPFLSPIFY